MSDVQPAERGSAASFFKPAQLKRKALAFASNPSKNFYDLARSLYPLHCISPASLKEIGKATGMSPRRLYYLAGVGRMLDHYAIEKSQVEKVGWTKAQIIARHIADTSDVSSAKLAEWLELAAATKARDLKAVLAGQPKSAAVRAVLLHLTPEEHDRFAKAILAHGATKKGRGLIGQEEALMKVIDSAT